MDRKEAMFLNEKGIDEIQLGLFIEAIQIFNIAIELDPQDRDNYFERGVLKIKLGLDEEALEDFSKILETEPENFEVTIIVSQLKNKLKFF